MEEKIVGQGRTAIIKALDEEKVIKYFKDFIDEESIQREFESSKLTHSLDIETPKPYELRLEGEERAIVYEYIKGINLADAITKYHKKASVLAYKAGEIHGRINNIKVEDLPSEKEVYKFRIGQVEDLDDETKSIIIKKVDTLPDGDYICHGDLHVENYLYDADNEAIYVVDWMSAHKGNPEGDIARTRLVMNSPVITAELKFLQKIVVNKLVQQFNAEYLAGYKSEKEIDDDLVDQYLLPLAAIRLTENVAHEKKWLLGIIKKELKKL